MTARKWPKRRNPVLHKINRTAERQRRDDISLGQGGSAGNPISGGGGGTVEWHPLSDILTPATGITIHANARYGWDNSFFYLQGQVDLGPGTATGTHPFYGLGDLSLQGYVSAPPAPADPETTNWQAPICLPGAVSAGAPVAMLLVDVEGISLGVPGVGSMIVGIDPAADISSGPTISLDGVALPWDHV